MSYELMVKGVNMEEVWLKDQVGFTYSRGIQSWSYRVAGIHSQGLG